MKEERKKAECGHGLYRADIYLFRHGEQIRGKQLSFAGTFQLR